MRPDGEDEKLPWPELEMGVLRGGISRLLYDSYHFHIADPREINVRRDGLGKVSSAKLGEPGIPSSAEALVKFSGLKSAVTCLEGFQQATCLNHLRPREHSTL